MHFSRCSNQKGVGSPATVRVLLMLQLCGPSVSEMLGTGWYGIGGNPWHGFGMHASKFVTQYAKYSCWRVHSSGGVTSRVSA